MSFDGQPLPEPGPPQSPVPRHVWVLVTVFVFVLGFAVGGTLRTALQPSQVAAGAAASAGSQLVAVPLATVGSVPIADVGRATHVAAAARRSVPLLPTADRRGKALPAHSGTGRRIVYQESTMHLWVVDADGTVVRDYPVTGRPGWPLAGTYHVFSKELSAVSPKYHVTFDWMVKFAHGHTLPIGFHSIPRWMGSGKPIQSASSLGAPIGIGGCVRQTVAEAKWLYAWTPLGTTVVVLR